MEKYLDEKVLKILRTQGVIAEHEVALEIGDLWIAEDVVKKSRRIIEKNNFSIQETNKRLLKG